MLWRRFFFLFHRAFSASMSESDQLSVNQTFKFKKPNRKPLRQRKSSDDEEDAAVDSEEQDIL